MPTKARNRSWRRAGPRSARRAVDGREQHVAHVGPLERQRTAAAAGAQAHRDGHRRDPTEPAGPVAQDVVELPARTIGSSPTALGRGDDRDEADDAGQVGAVEDVDPVDVGGRDPLALAATAASRASDCLEIGLRISEDLEHVATEPLDDHGHALAAADAHGLEAVAAAACPRGR